jgi:hypothetical protein
MKSFRGYMKGNHPLNIKVAITEFVRAAKNLLINDPHISINDLLAEHKVIKPIRSPRPTPEEIEAAGYRHDGMGNIIGKRLGRILKGSSGNNPYNPYLKYNLRIKGFGRKDAARGNYGEWTPQAHTLIFALVHRRWPRDGMVIDHIDGNKQNNHPDNLREVTHQENSPANKNKKQNIKIEPPSTLLNFIT